MNILNVYLLRKKAPRARIDAIHQMPPERVEAMRKKFRAILREHREAMYNRWMEVSPEERIKLRSESRKMTPEDHKAFLKEKDLLPLPPRKIPPPEDPRAMKPDTIDKAP